MNILKCLSLSLLIIAFTSCSKEDNSLPESVASENVSPQPSPTIFEFSGTMSVDKHDSNNVLISSYPLPNIVSKLEGVKPNFKLTVKNVNGESLKGEVVNSIDIEVPASSFYNLSNGQGLFIGGVYDGVYTGDSLKYKVLYQDYSSNNIHLEYKGHLINSY